MTVIPGDELVYLDINATTCLAPEALEAISSALQSYWGNPSSSHKVGLEAATKLHEARKTVAGFFYCRPDDVFFTSGATESLNWAIKEGSRAVTRESEERNVVIVSAVEHAAVDQICESISREGFDVIKCPVTPSGCIDINALRSILEVSEGGKRVADRLALFSLMHANAEVGYIQPIREAARVVREACGVLPFIHCDASQSVGKIPIVRDTFEGIDLLTIAGHKFYGPKGVGALIGLREGCLSGMKGRVNLCSFLDGGGQERGKRGGTECLPLIAGMAKALELIQEDNLEALRAKTRKLHELIVDEACRVSNLSLDELASFVRSNQLDSPQKYLPNTLSLAIKDALGHAFAKELGTDGRLPVCFSAGSACHSAGLSPVIEAMGVDPQWGRGTIRLSVGRYTTDWEIKTGAKEIGRKIGNHVALTSKLQ